MSKIDLSKAGGRLKYSIEVTTGKTFNEFADTVKSVAKRTLYNWTDKDELISKKLNPLLKELPGLSLKYIIHNDQSEKPQSEIATNLQITKEEDNEIKNKNMKTPKPEIPEEKMVQPIKKPKKPVTPERLKELEASCKRMQEIKNDFQINNVSKLERHLGVTHGIISNVLNMRNVISDITAEALKKYGYSYEWVMYGIEPKMKPKEIPVKIEPNEKIESPQPDYLVSELKKIIKEQNKIIEEKDKIIADRDKTIERKSRLGGGGAIQKTDLTQETG